jgi:serine/threonine-protein kinase
MLYELLVGRPPFAGETHIATAMMHVREPPPPARSVRGGIPRALDAAVLKALAKDPDDRYQSAPDFKRALAPSGSTGVTTAVFERPVARAEAGPVEHERGPSAFRWAVPVVILVAIAIGAAALISTLSGDDEPSRERGTGGLSVVRIDVGDAFDFDPEGGDGEHPSSVTLAYDGDPATFWDTEEYDGGALNKDGVGLLFDLGSPTEVARVRIRSATPGYSMEIRSASEAGDAATDYDVAETVTNAGDDERVSVDGRARYWLLWITGLPPGNPAEVQINEVDFFGP